MKYITVTNIFIVYWTKKTLNITAVSFTNKNNFLMCFFFFYQLILRRMGHHSASSFIGLKNTSDNRTED